MSLTFEYDSSFAGYICTGDTDETVTEIIIPDKYNNKPVVGVADGAFSGLDMLEKIVLGENVTFTGIDALNSTGLREIHINKKVESIAGCFDSQVLTDVYYYSTPADWEKINFIGADLDSLFNAKFHYNFTSAKVYLYKDNVVCSPVTDWKCIAGRPDTERIVMKNNTLPNNPREGETVILTENVKTEIGLSEITHSYNDDGYLSCRPLKNVKMPLFDESITLDGVADNECGYIILSPGENGYIILLYCPASDDEEDEEVFSDKPYLALFLIEGDKETAFVYFEDDTTVLGNKKSRGWYSVDTETFFMTETSYNENVFLKKNCYIFDKAVFESNGGTVTPSVNDNAKKFFDSIFDLTASKGVYEFKNGIWRGIDWNETIWDNKAKIYSLEQRIASMNKEKTSE